METESLRRLLENVRSGAVTVDQALASLRSFPFDDLTFAKIDTHRSLRKGFPEIVFCQGKTVAQVTSIIEAMKRSGLRILATRASQEVYQAVRRILPDATYYEDAKIVASIAEPVPRVGRVVVVTGGTGDIPVAEEAAVTAELVGSVVERLYDVGVAGLHRLLSNADTLFSARVLVVVAGMEGALPTVVGGLVDKPVIAVPTSVGYGASFGGLASLLSMLNCCALGVAVVNIDNGFGAGYLANLINRMGQTDE